jgi:hypothetical protein
MIKGTDDRVKIELGDPDDDPFISKRKLFPKTSFAIFIKYFAEAVTKPSSVTSDEQEMLKQCATKTDLPSGALTLLKIVDHLVRFIFNSFYILVGFWLFNLMKYSEKSRRFVGAENRLQNQSHPAECQMSRDQKENENGAGW